MQIKKLKLRELSRAEYNPRINMKVSKPEEYEKLKKSIKEFGYVNLLTANKRDGKYILVGGHQRLDAMEDLYGADHEIDVVIVELDENKEKALNIGLNKISGDWDNAKLEELLNELNETDIDIELTGFNLEEIEALTEEIADDMLDPEEDEYDLDKGLEEAEKNLISKQGDIWCLGRHRLIVGDSTKEETILKLFDGKKARLIVTDPPYNVAYEGATGMTIKNDSMEDSKFYTFLLDCYKNMYTVAEEGCPIYVFHADTEGVNFRLAFKEAGFKLSECLVWVKNRLVLGRQDYHYRHEPCLYGWKEGKAHYWYGERNKTTILGEDIDINSLSKEELVEIVDRIINGNDAHQDILYFDRPLKNDIHPTMKPLKLIAHILRNSSKKGDIVFDPFNGSGSTIMACNQLKRIGYGVEFDEKYADATVKRFIETAGHESVTLIRDGKVYKVEEIAGEWLEDGEN